MKVKLYGDELYPCYYVTEDGYGTEVEIPDDFLAHWERVNGEWNACQNTLADIYDAARKQEKLENAKKGIQPSAWDF